MHCIGNTHRQPEMDFNFIIHDNFLLITGLAPGTPPMDKIQIVLSCLPGVGETSFIILSHAREEGSALKAAARTPARGHPKTV